MNSIDLNCDMGEGMSTDTELMAYISSANIACGYHAGDADTMKRTIELALQHGVAIGAHPGFADKENFGRREHQLTGEACYQLIAEQLHILKTIADEFNADLHHVKPHGALYNMAAKDKNLAAVIAKTVKDFDASLILYGLSGSYLVSEAKTPGLKTASEVFADRTYTDDGNLTPRSQPGALISDMTTSIRQVLNMISEQAVISIGGKMVPIVAETICIHGDSSNPVEFARSINRALKENNIEIKTI